jgi:hypothetical protein
MPETLGFGIKRTLHDRSGFGRQAAFRIYNRYFLSCYTNPEAMTLMEFLRASPHLSQFLSLAIGASLLLLQVCSLTANSKVATYFRVTSTPVAIYVFYDFGYGNYQDYGRLATVGIAGTLTQLKKISH